MLTLKERHWKRIFDYCKYYLAAKISFFFTTDPFPNPLFLEEKHGTVERFAPKNTSAVGERWSPWRKPSAQSPPDAKHPPGAKSLSGPL